MQPKPAHLSSEYAAQFQDESVVAAYRHRPPYSSTVYDILAGLISKRSHAVLDVGCGPGQIARNMASRAERIDAIDWSERMIGLARHLPGGDDPHINWICGRAEDAPLHPPYGLVTAAASLHWMDWDVMLPRLRQALVPDGYLAIVDDGWLPSPWSDALGPAIAGYSTNKNYRPYDVVSELEQRGLFRQVGAQQTSPEPFNQTVEDYIESFHARNGFSRDRVSAAHAAAFDQTVRALVSPHASDGRITLHIFTTIVWGVPTP